MDEGKFFVVIVVPIDGNEFAFCNLGDDVIDITVFPQSLQFLNYSNPVDGKQSQIVGVNQQMNYSEYVICAPPMNCSKRFKHVVDVKYKQHRRQW